MGRLSLFAAAAALASVALAQEAAAAPCEPAEVMVLFDRSTSMKRGKIDGVTKWAIATAALKEVVGDYQSQAAFGLSIFPEKIAAGAPATCKTGLSAVVATPKLSALASISSALSNAYPGDNDWTPIGQSLKEALTLPFVTDAAQQTKRRYILLITDGAQSCPDGTNGNPDEDPSEIWPAATLADYAKQLKDKGVKVYVVGFGKQSTGSGDDGVDPYALNQIAFMGGTARTGCDPASTQATNPLNCYAQADNKDELSAALEEFALEVSNEVCDGIDNNCNGMVDENISRDCTSACGAGTQKCIGDDVWSTCTATQPDPEICDGQDNDCDGQVDEGCACQNGQTRPCDKKPGICQPGTQRCVNGQWNPVCEGEVRGTPEICDGIDSNCDGIGDIDCTCINGEEEVCGGPNIGQCKTGVRRCVNGEWGSCVGAVGPSQETCDGIDNDCDGVIDDPILGEDDDLPHNLCRIDQICQNGHCIDVPPMNPPGGNNVPGGDAAGCACTTSGQRGAPLGTLLLVLGTVAVVMATRRRS